ncbi:MAG: DUF177 domain-containing protein [Candidatus Omnitrophica bacterium]|nr:DUF177 domain-containing protein [Candidatus Omnitrophota bacterium]
MKILVNQVSTEGLFLEEDLDPAQLDLETELIKFDSVLKLKAHAVRITNALAVDLNIKAKLHAGCSRCLDEFSWELNKDVRLNYPLDASIAFVDLNPEIREEIILDYPIKPLCSLNCKGLCTKCGNNLNQGGCNCGST